MTRQGKILVVDDERIHRIVLRGMLKPQGYQIMEARDGKTMRQAIDESLPDLILLDVLMPGETGLELCRKLKRDEQTKMIPVIIVTSLENKRDKLRGLEAGAEDYLAKPVDKLELTTRVRNLLKAKEYNDLIRFHKETLEKQVSARTRELESTLIALKTANKIINQSYLDTIYRLAVAAEFKDEETGRHIRRMSLVVGTIARAMGLADSDVETMLYASPMHDIGKIGIPDKILLKPGPLNKDEWKVMKSHTDMGAVILSGSSSKILEMAKSIALSHHEKFDGSGYPQGLSGDSIPIEGRITAIADVFDALVSERPYKPAFSVDKSIAIIRDTTGTHFDPRVSAIFMDNIDMILKIITDAELVEDHTDLLQTLGMPSHMDDMPLLGSQH